MSDKIRKLQEERAKVWARAQELEGRADSEAGLTAEERTNWDAALDRVGELSADIERLERSAKYGEIDFDTLIEERKAGPEGPADAPAGKPVEERYEEAFSGFLRRGINGLAAEQRQLMNERMTELDTRAQSTSTTAGGYTIPPGFLTRITETMKAFGGILNVAELITTDSGNPLQWPTFDGTAQTGQLLSENTQETALDLAFGQKTLGAYTYSSRIVQVSLQLLQDSAFNLDEFVARQLGIRIGRAVAAHLATGTGSSQPEGLFTNATTGKTGTTGQTTSVIYDDLVDLIHSVDPAYRAQNPIFVLNDSSLKVIRKLKDSQGRPLWEPSLQVGAPDTILGYGYVVDQGVASMAANAKSIGFGDVRSAYVVRQVAGGQMLRLAERYADYLQVGYLGFLRLDAKPNDTAAFKVYANSAT
ncbi:phage major capsid protein [Amycolatopsis kentuckyensis]|uniref:phage major capsid protein n=1 Tax=Amycolatopsis kentuckyensis TaxID=218823 RepID=UPI000A39E152|nr:phage major capsid protein [Amycolatopsis kentuckyensis]